MSKRQRRVTSADVARASGVSQATVSYVLNNDPRQTIPAETRERVQAAARALGYQPSAAARTLRSGHSQLVLVVLPFEQVDPDIARHLRALEAGLAAHGFSLIWYVGRSTMSGATHPSANLTPAVVISYGDETDPASQAFVQQFDVPVIWVSNSTTRQEVGRAQAGFLCERGLRRLVFAAPERADLQWLAQARLAGVRQWCAERGLAPPQVQVMPETRAAAATALLPLLHAQPQPVGICCYNDDVAFAVLAALVDMGVPIPASAAVIGCDDIPLAAFSHPALTTIRFDYQGLQQYLVEQILAIRAGESLAEMPSLPLSVVARASA